MIEKPRRRLTLQECLVGVEKYAPILREYLRATFYPSLSDVQDLSRPKRKHYPTLLALQNSLRNLQSTMEELQRAEEAMLAWFAQIDEHIQRQRTAQV